jgi:hypothetical protein
VRPQVRFAPYVGYEEHVGGLTYRYSVPDAGSEEPSDGGSVQAVEAVQRFARGDDAQVAWRAEVREFSARAKGPAACYRIKGTVANDGLAALWKLPAGQVIVVRSVSGSPPRGRARATAPALISRLDTRLPPVLAAPGAQSTSCGAITSAI